MTICIKTMTEDDDKDIVAQACLSIADIVKEYGYMAVEPYMTRLVDATLFLLKRNRLVSRQNLTVTLMMMILNMIKSLWMQFLFFFLHLLGPWVLILHPYLQSYMII